MAVILNLETASTNCSVCIARKGGILALKEFNSPSFSHSEQLHVFIGDTLQEAGLEVAALDAIAVSSGPGSYTGLRIGVSAAKGLCYSLGVPLIAVPTLRALAAQLHVNRGILIPMLDARRMEVYSAVFSHDFEALRETRAEIIIPESFSEYLDAGEVHLIGSGATKCREVLQHPNLVFHDSLVPSAREMAALSFDRYTDKLFEDAAYFEPSYLKDFLVQGKKAKGD
jgi:tRNA threonylcarbamoyladenosine biosynthesis protein TsaB